MAIVVNKICSSKDMDKCVRKMKQKHKDVLAVLTFAHILNENHNNVASVAANEMLLQLKTLVESAEAKYRLRDEKTFPFLHRVHKFFPHYRYLLRKALYEHLLKD